MLKEYHKIETIFKRDEKTKKLIEGEFTNPTVEFLKDNKWEFTEKIDGTNIRVYWDGHKVTFHGRTDRAQIPSDLVNRLNELFGGEANEQLFEQKFGEMEVVLCGEGYGEKIQNGGLYRKGQDFILFDVIINDNFQPRESVSDIANYFNINVVPVLFFGTIDDAINFIKMSPVSEIAEDKHTLEGLVGRPLQELKDRTGKRIICKIKVRDFE